jgi:predicted nucleotidyltransferase component of viral defense system
MLSLNEIQNYYPEELKPFKRFILREYLQYKILEILFESEYAHKLSFLGGTCLRIVHEQQRFSEDLDFDNFNLSQNEFQEIATHIKQQLTKLGYEIEMRNVIKGAFHCYIKFPDILFQENLSGHPHEKILIQLDTEPHLFEFTPDTHILNKFDVFTPIFTTPRELLLAQKFYAIVNRKRNKGRDFFDIVFLLGQNIKPNFDYLDFKLQVKNQTQLKEVILQRCNQIDMQEMASDVAPFLFNPKDVKKVLLFKDYLKQVDLG